MYNLMNFSILIYIFKLKSGLNMGIGDWGLGIGDWAQSPIPNPLRLLLQIIFDFKY